MKRVRFMLILIMASVIGISVLYYTSFYVGGPDVFADSYILIDADTNKTLVANNEDIPLAAASMTKLMTELLVLEHIHEGKLGWDDELMITEETATSIGVKIDVEPGMSVSVRDLFSSMVVGSANNASVVLAEAVAGSEEEFTKMMNEQARELGLSTKTHFVNATGLPTSLNEESFMTAQDVAILAAHLIQMYPEVLETAKLPVYTLSYDGTPVHTTNKMLHETNQALWFEGIDGLKTGFTDQAGYCFTGTAMQGDKRLISVVMGTNDTDARFIETKKLFSYGFKKPYVVDMKSYVRALGEKMQLLFSRMNNDPSNSI